MNPLLFADWGRMNRLFTKLMWTVAVVMVCAMFVVATSTGRAAHGTAAGRHAGMAAGAHVTSARAGEVSRMGTP